jgi:hypothetical protein
MKLVCQINALTLSLWHKPFTGRKHTHGSLSRSQQLHCVALDGGQPNMQAMRSIV